MSTIILLAITKRGGPPEAIEIRGTQPRKPREEESYTFDNNLEGGHQLEKGHTAELMVNSQGRIEQVLEVRDAANTRLSLEEAPPALIVRQAAAARAFAEARSKPAPASRVGD